ncbi:MAG: hypothetical protein J1E97_07590 [Muribaculaceae bacterium]|nr:hypothetical protein [Muribaculaceae bacterium]
MKLRILFSALILSLLGRAQERLIVVNEGLWQTDNGKLSYFEDGEMVSNEWFRDVNGRKLGDTPNDIIRINDNLIAIAVNWSNIVQFITPVGVAVAETEDVPNNRKLATDGRFLYVTSYGHEVAIDGGYQEFEKGFVAKIDVQTFKVVDAVEVGYEPEGIAFYDGYIFVANTGGYAFQENHPYETTVSVIDASTMRMVREIDTGQINLYGKMSQTGRYLCINSPGDYYDVMAATIIFNCRAAIENEPDEDCFIKLEYAATYNTVDLDGNFLAIGSRYSYYSGGYEFNYVTINPVELFATGGSLGVEDSLPGSLKEYILKLTMPYGIYVNPYTGYYYATDAGEFTGAGALLQFTPQGEYIGKWKTYINPAHFLALKPDNYTDDPEQKEPDDEEDSSIHNPIEYSKPQIYNLQGIPIDHPRSGEIYISNGKKFLQP